MGVSLGGKTRAEATRLLEQELTARTSQAVPARIGTASIQLLPRSVGLRVDVNATIETAARVRPGLGGLMRKHEVAPVIVVDAARLTAELRRRAGDAVTRAVQPQIRYDGLTPTAVYPVAGKELDPGRVADAFRAGWLRRSPIEVPLSEVPSAMSREDVDALADTVAAPAVAAPVTVETAKGTFEISPQVIRTVLVLKAGTDGRITPRVDPTQLRRQLATRLTALEGTPRDASIVLRDGAPTVVPHVDGRSVDVDRLAADLLGVLPQRQVSHRRITTVMTVVPANVTTAAAGRLGVKEKVSSFTTRFVAGQARTVNIKRMADLLRGTLVLPGKTFSINGIVGERTAAKGFVDAPGIAAGGVLKNGSGGGVSQVATTVFNAMYYAGLQDIAHQPHSYYFSRYPAVIEATVSWPDLDLKFRNDSPYGVLVHTAYTDNSLTVSMWSTKRYEIRTVYGPRTDPTQPETRRLQTKDCLPTAGIPGFRQEAFRVFVQNGKEVKRERFVWRYAAEPKFICDAPR